MGNYIAKLARDHDYYTNLFFQALLNCNWKDFKVANNKLNNIEKKLSDYRCKKMIEEVDIANLEGKK